MPPATPMTQSGHPYRRRIFIQDDDLECSQPEPSAPQAAAPMVQPPVVLQTHDNITAAAQRVDADQAEQEDNARFRYVVLTLFLLAIIRFVATHLLIERATQLLNFATQ